MKKINVLLILICFVLIPLTSYAAEVSAGSGGADSVNNINIYDLIPNGSVSTENVTISGTVAHYAGFNDDRVSRSPWMVMDRVTLTHADGTVDENWGEITVYGLGPVCYWDKMGATRPEIDMVLTVNAIQVTYGDGDVKYVVLSVVTRAYIIVDGLVVEDEYTTLEVRSVAADTYGIPLWLVKNQSKQDSNTEVGGGTYNK